MARPVATRTPPHACTTHQLPCILAATCSAVQMLVSRSSQEWGGAMADLLHATTALLSDRTSHVMHAVLGRVPAAHAVACSLAEALLADLNAATALRLKDLHASESICAFTIK